MAQQASARKPGWFFQNLWTITIALLIVAANGIGFVRWTRKRAPEYALERAAAAVRHHDPTLFDAWVDVDKLAGSYYEQHLLPNRTAADEAQHKRDTAALARRLRRWVVTSRIDESERPRLTLLGTVLYDALTQHTSTVRSISRGGRTVIATVDIADRAGRSATLEIRLDRRRGGTWRIMEVTNVSGVIHDLRRSEFRRVSNIEKQLARSVHLSPPRSVEAESSPSHHTYSLTLTPRKIAKLEFSVTCESTSGSTTDAGHLMIFREDEPKTMKITCVCTAAPCPKPYVRVDAVWLRNGAEVRRAEPLALD